MSQASDQRRSVPPRTALIGVDWGTSALRAYRMAADGAVLEVVRSPGGILQVEDGRFAEMLAASIGAWRTPGLPVVLSGMIGSRQGWIEMPYLAVPAAAADIAAALLAHPDDPSIRLVPGLCLDPPDRAPDVMRGEETEIVGAIGGRPGRHLLIMPGTHSKWVLAEDGRIVWFATFMTGELFALLKAHSILGRLMAGDVHDRHAFEQGLEAARTLPGGLLQRLFSARTLGLFDRLPAGAIAAYLSGLLIGSEILEALGNLDGAAATRPPVTVIGASPLADRYLQATGHFSLPSRKAGDAAAAAGHYLLARAAGLLPPSTGSHDDRLR